MIQFRTTRSRWRQWLFVALMLALVAWFFWPVSWGHSKESARATACLSNLKRLAIATQVYLEDYDQRFPLEDWTDSTAPYRKNEMILTCPEVFKIGGYGYAMNTSAVGKPYRTPEMDRTVLYFETDTRERNVVMNLAGRVRDRHQTRFSNVAYCDGSARRIYRDVQP